MSQKPPRPSNVASSLPMLEMMRQGAEPKPDDEDKDGPKIPTIWKVFGSTILSITAMVTVSAYQAISSNAAEVRNEVSALNNEMRKEYARVAEHQGDLVKKDECDARVRGVWSSVKELQEDRKQLIALKEHCAKLAELNRQADDDRKKMADEVRSLREERIQAQERRALLAELAALRERLAGLEAKQQAKEAPAADAKAERRLLDGTE